MRCAIALGFPCSKGVTNDYSHLSVKFSWDMMEDARARFDVHWQLKPKRLVVGVIGISVVKYHPLTVHRPP
jgi:hypothetical protein